MTRSELEHLIRAAGTIVDDIEIIIIGSQSILGQFPDAPELNTLIDRLKHTRIPEDVRAVVASRIRSDARPSG